MKLKSRLYAASRGWTPLRFFLGVSITNLCNRKCDFCLYQSPRLEKYPLLDWVRAQPKEMDPEPFERMMAGLGPFKHMINAVGLTGKGEPFLHPQFMRFARAIDGAGVDFSITTNGDMIGKHIWELSRLRRLTMIRVSVYELETMRRIRARYSDDDRYPRIVFHNMTGTHVEGVRDGFKLWSPGLDDQCTMQPGFNRIASCRKPFSYLTVNPDGSVTVCNSFHEIGNAFETPLHRIWNNEAHRKYNAAALGMKDVPDSDCPNCGFNLYEK